MPPLVLSDSPLVLLSTTALPLSVPVSSMLTGRPLLVWPVSPVEDNVMLPAALPFMALTVPDTVSPLLVCRLISPAVVVNPARFAM